VAQQNLTIGTADAKAGDTYFDAFTKVEANFTELYSQNLTGRVVVSSASDLAGTLDSTKEYFLDGVIDMGSQSIEVPSGGLYISGYNFDTSKLTSAQSSYTMFTSPTGGSGNVVFKDFAIEVTGTGSQVYNLESDTGAEAFEVARINYNNCTSLGEIDNYRQGLEIGTGRFGGSPSLTLTGAWSGGYLAETLIVRSLTDGSYSLFQAGAGFVMASRFRSNINADLPATASLLDFAPSNFTNPSTLQLQGCILSRSGSFNAADTNLTPNIDSTDLESSWRDNIGLPNTFEGGTSTITTETATTVSASSTYYDLAGTWTATDLQHFDAPSNGQLRHTGQSPIEYRVSGNLVIDGTANDEINVKIRKYDDSAATFSDVLIQARQINSLVGARDVAFFTLIANVTLEQNDYIYLQVSNETAANNVTVELDSFFMIETR
jgi:hypothetical protein